MASNATAEGRSQNRRKFETTSAIERLQRRMKRASLALCRETGFCIRGAKGNFVENFMAPARERGLRSTFGRIDTAIYGDSPRLSPPATLFLSCTVFARRPATGTAQPGTGITRNTTPHSTTTTRGWRPIPMRQPGSGVGAVPKHCLCNSVAAPRCLHAGPSFDGVPEHPRCQARWDFANTSTANAIGTTRRRRLTAQHVADDCRPKTRNAIQSDQLVEMERYDDARWTCLRNGDKAGELLKNPHGIFSHILLKGPARSPSKDSNR